MGGFHEHHGPHQHMMIITHIWCGREVGWQSVGSLRSFVDVGVDDVGDDVAVFFDDGVKCVSFPKL